ncbi:MAG: DUF2062 domain-containing protein [Methylococcales bacterium]|nr:DUF2062 domain-containing protein [Methylococcales bacterium]
MPRKLIQKLLPHPDKIKHHKNLQFLGERLHEPNLWHLSRRSTALAFAIGLFVAWIPVPGQMVIAAAMAFYLRANLPVAVVLVWITNPVTMPPMFYAAYRLGRVFIAADETLPKTEFNLDMIMSGLGDIWQPFLLGCLLLGVISAGLGYLLINGAWRYNVSQRWRKRPGR